MKRSHPEHDEQAALFLWASLQETVWPELRTMFAIPNSARRSPRQGAWMKAEGMRAGVWDIFLPAVRTGYAGLFVEMKSGKNKLTAEQEKFMYLLLDKYAFRICYSWKEAACAITDYLEEKLF